MRHILSAARNSTIEIPAKSFEESSCPGTGSLTEARWCAAKALASAPGEIVVAYALSAMTENCSEQCAARYEKRMEKQIQGQLSTTQASREDSQSGTRGIAIAMYCVLLA